MKNYRLMLRERRKELKMSQRELAEQAGVTQQFINDIEAARKEPSVSVLQKMCDALEIEFLCIKSKK